ncbi:MAG: CsbD family protein [Acidobacteriota bacterium]
MRQHEVRGKVKKAKGRVKEAVGILSGDKKMEREGSLQRALGAVEEGFGTARRKVGEVLTNLGNTVKK